ncbi:MAG: OmpH family outer membrane protein [Rhodospirillales bacterium]|nr:OmpH family outer membrane protein [Rhodospirillales bacterium]
MKKIFTLLALMGLLSFAPVNEAFAQEASTGIKVAVIDINVILRDAAAFKSIRQQIGVYRNTFQGEIQKEEETLRNGNQELARQRTLLSAEAFAEKRREFEAKVVAVQRLVQQRKKNLDKSQSEAMRQIQDVLNVIVTAISEEQNISLILRKDQTVLATMPLQITKQVLERLDVKMPTIVVSDPSK